MDSPTNNKLTFAMAAQDFGRLLETSSGLPKSEFKQFVPEFTAISNIKEDSLKPVFPVFKDLDEAVGELNVKIGGIVKRQNEDYLNEYRSEMLGIQKELMEMKRKYEEFMSNQTGGEQTDELKKLINSYKDEVLRLDKTILKKDKQILALKNKVSFLEEERKFLSDYIVTAVRRNKLISIERHTKPPENVSLMSKRLKSRGNSERRSVAADKSKNLDNSYQDDQNDIFKLSKISPDAYQQDLTNHQFETGLLELDDFLNSLKNRDFGDRFRILKDVESFCKSIVFSYEKRFQESKKKIMKEKTRLDGFVNSKAFARAELADIFEDCIKRVKSTIERRRLEGFKIGREGSEFAEKRAAEAIKSIRIENKDLLSQDKEKLLELFVFDDTVLNVIKYLISGGPGTNPRSTAKDLSYKRHNQSIGNTDAGLSLLEASDVSIDKTIRDRRKSSHQSVRTGNLQPFTQNLPQIVENHKDTLESEAGPREERRTTSAKIDQLIGTSQTASTQMVNNSLRMRDITKNYKI